MSAVRTCPWCEAQLTPGVDFCSACEAPAGSADEARAIHGLRAGIGDVAISGPVAFPDSPPVDDTTFHLVDLTGGDPDSARTVAATTSGSWTTALVALLALITGAIGASFLPSDAGTDASAASDTAQDAEVQNLGPADAGDSVRSDGVESEGLPGDTRVSVDNGEPRPGTFGFHLSWAVGSSVFFAAEDPTGSGDSTKLSLSLGATVDSGPVVLGEDVVVSVKGTALIVRPRLSTSVLGPADLVLPSGRPDTVWLGVIVRDDNNDDVAPLLAPPPGRVRWSEVDADGDVLRTATREPDLDFGTPDLVWGFQSTIYRLSDRTRHPWRFISPGYPVAVGPNDVILNVCSSNRTTCERQWFDARTGEPGGPLLDTIADNFAPHHGGRLSPDGRWAITDTTAEGVRIHELATGELADHACLSTDHLVWGPRGLLACHGILGVTIHDLASGRVQHVAHVPTDATIAVRRLGD